GGVAIGEIRLARDFQTRNRYAGRVRETQIALRVARLGGHERDLAGRPRCVVFQHIFFANVHRLYCGACEPLYSGLACPPRPNYAGIRSYGNGWRSPPCARIDRNCPRTGAPFAPARDMSPTTTT